MSVLLYLGMLTLYHRNVSANGGPDAVPLLLSFYMMFCPSGAAYSLDAKRAARKRGTVAEPLIVPWGVRLLQMQICLIYFQSCVIKCRGDLWLNGTYGSLRAFQSRVRHVQPGMARAVSLADQHDDPQRPAIRILSWRSGSGSGRREAGRSWPGSCSTWESGRLLMFRDSAKR